MMKQGIWLQLGVSSSPTSYSNGERFKKQRARKLYPKQREVFDVTKELETQGMTMNQELRSRNQRKGKILFENYAIRMKILADIESQIAADEKV